MTFNEPTPGGASKILFRSDMTVHLVDARASDTDVVSAARVSTAGERSLGNQKYDETSSAGLIRYLMRNRHGSPFEHNSLTFFVQAPIFVFRELMRHRTASYNEESGRYRELDPVFYVPAEDRDLQQVGKAGEYRFEPGTYLQRKQVRASLEAVATEAYLHYRDLLRAGVAREVARMVLPVNIYSSAYVTMNARALMNVLSLRIQDETATYPSYPQREIELVAEQMEALWAQLMPATHSAFCAAGRVAP